MRYARSIVVCLFVIGGVLQIPLSASAATGDQVGSVTFGTNCPSGLGVGITFDGTNLWYSCDGMSGETPPDDLYRADPSTGDVTASYNIAGSEGLGALAYDATRNAIWVGWGSFAGAGTIRLIQLDESNDVTGTTVGFTADEAYSASPLLDDGLAFDAQDDSLYVSPDASTTIYHYNAVPPGVGSNLIGSFPWNGTDCYNSGLAIGGDLLFEGSNGCSHVWVVDKSTQAASFDFGTGGVRDEGLTCDSKTFAQDVVWSMEAYDSNFSGQTGNRRAFAFEVPTGTCGVGGEPGQNTLTVTNPGSGSGTITFSYDETSTDCTLTASTGLNPSCSKAFDHGTTVILSASPASGSTFSGWSGEGCSGTGTCTVTMNADKTVFASFNQNTNSNSASGFVPPGGTIQTCSSTSATDDTCSTIKLPNTGNGAFITITEQPGSSFNFCGGKCSNQTTTYSFTPTDSYTDINNPPKVILRYRTPGTSTKADMYFLKFSKAIKIADCRKIGIANPNPCVSARNRLGFGTNDLQVQVNVTSDEPTIGKR
jgi:hypothetical protein